MTRLSSEAPLARQIMSARVNLGAPAVAPKYMLDTNICVYLTEGSGARWERVSKRVIRCEEGEMVISAVTLAELRHGIAVAKDDQQRDIRASSLSGILAYVPVIPFDAAAANCCEQLGAFARQRERENDKLIAAHAFQRKLILVTNNLKDFIRYPGLRLENWT